MNYGPQTTEIRALIEKIKGLTLDQAYALGVASGEFPRDSWYKAWDDASDALWDSGRGDVWDDSWSAIGDADWGAHPIRGAILALIVRDLISAEDFNILYGPWRSVMN